MSEMYLSEAYSTDTALPLGVLSEWVPGRIDADAALAYARASNDPNHAYEERTAVPPLFTASLVLPVMALTQRRMPPGAISGVQGGVHGEHQVIYHRHLTPGQSVKMRSSLRAARQTKAGSLTTNQIEIFDTNDVPLLTHYWGNLQLKGHLVEGECGETPPEHTFPEEARDKHLGSYTVDIDVDQGFRYAGASGDRPPHTIDDESAAREGHPFKILQGMCTFALCSGGIVEFGTDGDPSRLHRIAGRFARPCHPGRELRVDFYDGGVTDAGYKRVAWEAVSDGVTVMRHGVAEFS
jgi:acyl dehydratase